MPDHDPEAEQEEALDVDQVKVTVLPKYIWSSEIDNVILAPGTGGSGVLPPPPPPPQLAITNNKDKYTYKINN